MKGFTGNPRTIDEADLAQLGEWMLEFGDLSGLVHELNTDELITGNQRSKIVDVNEAEIVIEERFDPPTRTGTVALGYVIFAGEKFNYRQVLWDEEKSARANLIANKAGGDWDFIELAEWPEDVLEEAGFTEAYLRKQEDQLAQLALMLDAAPAPPVEGVPFAQYDDPREKDEDFAPFRFGDFAGRIEREIYESFVEAFEEAKEHTNSPMLSDVLKGWLNV